MSAYSTRDRWLDAAKKDRGVCETCPFGDENGWSDAAEQAIGLGCLPDIPEAMKIKRETGCNWGCHSEKRICSGFVAACAEAGFSYRGDPTISFAVWANEGVDAAVDQARRELRERTLDTANHGETIAESLIPWASLRDTLDAEADALRSRWAANQVGYFEERENG